MLYMRALDIYKIDVEVNVKDIEFPINLNNIKKF